MALFVHRTCDPNLVPAKKSSLRVMWGGLIPETMIHWTDWRSDILMVWTEKGRGEVEQHLRTMRSHEVVQTYLEKSPPGASPPIRRVLTFRYVVNQSEQCPLSGIHKT